MYSLDLTHPATAVLVSYLLRLRERLSVAAEAGLLPAGVAVAVVGISINGKSIKVDQLSAVDTWSEVSRIGLAGGAWGFIRRM